MTTKYRRSMVKANEKANEMSDKLLFCHSRRMSLNQKCPTCGAKPKYLCEKVKRRKT